MRWPQCMQHAGSLRHSTRISDLSWPSRRRVSSGEACSKNNSGVSPEICARAPSMVSPWLAMSNWSRGRRTPRPRMNDGGESFFHGIPCNGHETQRQAAAAVSAGWTLRYSRTSSCIRSFRRKPELAAR